MVATLNPHAGYMYSGPVAAHSFYAVSGGRPPSLFVIVGPNHYGVGSGVAVPLSDEWETPLGDAKVDVAAARELMELSGVVDIDDAAHAQEHSIETQVPFLQYIFGAGVKILPVSMALQDRETAVELGDALGRLLAGKDALMIASSDLTHYERAEVAAEKDMKAIEHMLSYDVDALYEYIDDASLTMCGYGPAAAVMVASRALGANKASLLKYATSGDTGGDASSVVGYPSMAFYG